MANLSIARRARFPRMRRDRTPTTTPFEARLLQLRQGNPQDVTLAPSLRQGRPQDVTPAPSLRQARRDSHSAAPLLRVSLLLVVCATIAVGSYVLHTSQGATRHGSIAAPVIASGSGLMPVNVAAGDLTLRVTVTSNAVPWFWCLESSRGLPPEEHVCGNSGLVAASPGEPAVTTGVVHLDSASVRDASFFVRMYCQDSCAWHVDATQP